MTHDESMAALLVMLDSVEGDGTPEDLERLWELQDAARALDELIANAWDEDAHPRDDRGRFGSKEYTSITQAGSLWDDMKKLGATVAHAEHAAKAWVADGCAAQVAKLPPKAQSFVKGACAVARVGGGAAIKYGLFANFTLAQYAAEKVAKARGATDEEAKQLRGLLSTIDNKTFESLKIGWAATAFVLPLPGVAHALHLPAMVAATVPVASASYLAYAAVDSGIRGIKKAGGLVARAFKRSTATANASPLDAMVDALEECSYDDWFIALLSAAIDQVGSLGPAVEVAKATYADSSPPSGGSGYMDLYTDSDTQQGIEEMLAAGVITREEARRLT